MKIKLVTGLEAIKSGRRFRRYDLHLGGCGPWIEPDAKQVFSLEALRAEEWEVEPRKPREWLVHINEDESIIDWHHIPKSQKSICGIKVREVLDEH